MEQRRQAASADSDEPGRAGPQKMLLWQKDEVVYALQGWTVTEAELLRIAESIR